MAGNPLDLPALLCSASPRHAPSTSRCRAGPQSELSIGCIAELVEPYARDRFLTHDPLIFIFMIIII